MKIVLFVLTLTCAASAVAAECDFTPDKDQLQFSFTGYGFPDKSYKVTKNTFTQYELTSASGKLLGGTIDIDATSLDTSHDLNNGTGGTWPASISEIRDANIVNGLFKNFVNPGKIQVKVSSIDDSQIDLDVTMNGETRTIPMTYSVAGGVLSAEGRLELMDFNTSEALKKLEALCTLAWHQGKTWTDADIYFSVPVKEPSC